uniref:Uncharacterized protein n=1 Tax=Heliothis virescens TaxID=7102 RepID=A0A2A4K8L9_HELVI
MSEPLRPKMSLSEEMFSSFALRNKSVKTSNIDSDPGTSYEVFRNNTTAVEVIVKEVPKAKKKSAPSEYQDVSIIKRLQDDVDRLRNELNIANNALTRSRKGFLAMVREMKKQLDAANQRELDTQTKNLALQLDNEKLKSLLVAKTNLVNKFKKELNSMKRVMRYVIKSICYAPQVSENVTCSTDPEYDDFESELKKNTKVKFVTNVFDEMGGTFDSSISKDTKYSFDKRLL